MTRVPDFLIVIPARLHSKRLPRKALLSDTGKPLLAHTVDQARLCKERLDLSIWIAGDSMELIESVQCCEPFHYDPDPSIWCGTQRAAKLLEAFPDLQKVNAVINWQVDEPCVKRVHIEHMCGLFYDEPIDIVTLVAPLTEAGTYSTDIVNVHEHNFQCLNFTRDCNSLSNREHVGIYAFRPSVLMEIGKLPQSDRSARHSLEQLTWLDNGYDISAVRVAHAPISVNTEDDYKRFCEHVKESL